MTMLVNHKESNHDNNKVNENGTIGTEEGAQGDREDR